MAAVSSAYDAVGITVEEAPEPPPVDVAADPGEQWVATVAAELDGDNSLWLVKPTSNPLEGRDGWEDILQLTTTQVFAGTGRAITAPVNGEFLMFVDSDNNLRYISADGSGEEVINADGDWYSIALSPDGRRLVATATYDEPVIHYFDFDSEDTYHQIELYQPTTQEGIRQDIVRYADVLQWDATGTYVNLRRLQQPARSRRGDYRFLDGERAGCRERDDMAHFCVAAEGRTTNQSLAVERDSARRHYRRLSVAVRARRPAQRTHRNKGD